jgi:glycosyltransferase involved in cell wall biosynthesis
MKNKSKKLITFAVPCYNSESYMERCINTLLKGKEDVEIIIVDDGSTDKTAKIADGYQKRYPKIIKVIHKVNGGHGSGVNAGLKEASGQYFKVVDSDDWLDENSLLKLIDKIKYLNENSLNVDLFVCNYIYDHLYDGFQKVMSYSNVFHENQITNWEETASFKSSQYLIMHALIYKTKILKESKIKLPEHTFYVDNLVALLPLSYVKDIYYMNIDLYHYFIGREDQSVNEKVMMGRIDQQIKVTKLIIDSINLDDLEKKSVKLKKYVIKFTSMMVTICDVYLLMINDKKSLEKREKLWEYIKNKDIKLYKQLKRSLSGLTYIPGKLGNFVSLNGYKIAKKIFKFN